MGRIVLAIYVSVDGVVDDPGGAEGKVKGGSWTFPYWNDELSDMQNELLMASGALLLGRRTYEGFAAAWPKMEAETGDFGRKMNSMPKYVAAPGKAKLEWNATPLEGNVPEAVAKLKRESDQQLLIYGSATLVRSLMPHDLVDQYRLMVHPVVLGEGRRLFEGGLKRKELRLSGSRATAAGVAVLDYEPVRK